MRTFFCFPVVADTRERLDNLARMVRRASQTRASWVATENYHVTVRFLGEIEPSVCTDLHNAARDAVAGIPPFTFTVDRVSAFPREERPRVLWAGGEAPPPFDDLLDRLGGSLHDLGFERARRDPHFHLTLARIKGRPDEALLRSIRPLGSDGWTFQVDRLVLMESRLTRSGAQYDPLFSVRLAGDTSRAGPNAL
jgi:2'-5' RNA ligase